MARTKSWALRCRPRELGRLYDEVEQMGCEVSYTSNGHVRIVIPGEGLYFGPSTASDVRAIRNLRSALRRRGLAL